MTLRSLRKKSPWQRRQRMKKEEAEATGNDRAACCGCRVIKVDDSLKIELEGTQFGDSTKARSVIAVEEDVVLSWVLRDKVRSTIVVAWLGLSVVSRRSTSKKVLKEPGNGLAQDIRHQRRQRRTPGSRNRVVFGLCSHVTTGVTT
ncbi:hypothetical protein B296_00053682 [Ensete ventricosum]|uniref:Uncharacterized protein n=1 Tax=Ensete ventricosum TaxID=4639 RepID=A0A426X3H1_ENSVE|nr:hypothetical protein B296_00053682 [Ensete ventricosum]